MEHLDRRPDKEQLTRVAKQAVAPDIEGIREEAAGEAAECH